MSSKRTLLINVLIVLVGALLFIPGLGSVRLFDWDEINFAESAREMVVTGDWFNVRINFESFWEKPPLFIWMQALSMKVFGVGEFAARFPNAIIGILTLLLLFNIGRKVEDERFGMLWMGMYLISFLPFFYFKSGIIDPWFNFFIFLGVWFFSRYSDPEAFDRRMLNASLSAASIGLGILTKGPVAFLIFALTFFVWLCVRKFNFTFRWKDVAAYVVVLCLVGGSWFIALALTGHTEVIKDFIEYQIRLFETKDAGHGGFLLYHFVILFIGVIPASIFALSTFHRSVLKDERNQSLANLFRWMMVSFWVVLLLFTVVRTKIIHYSSFCYFPLTFLAAYAAAKMLDGKLNFRKVQSVLLIICSVLYGVLLTAITLFDRFKDKLIPYIDDPFAVSCMEATSEWVGFEPLVGLVLVVTTVWFCLVFRSRRDAGAFRVLAFGNILFMMTVILCAVGEVEKYSQASAVDFYVSRKGEDCYVIPAYFKSYAQYFYTDRQPQNRCDDFDWLCRGPIDKKCYFVVEDIPGDIEKFRADAPEAEFLYRRSGFLFFVREKPCDGDDASCSQQEYEQVE